jgi:hypothetical protein
MNKTQKILTIVALAVFGAIIFFHYVGIWFYLNPFDVDFKPPLITDVHMPLFVLAVFYTGLFFITSTRKG